MFREGSHRHITIFITFSQFNSPLVPASDDENIFLLVFCITSVNIIGLESSSCLLISTIYSQMMQSRRLWTQANFQWFDVTFFFKYPLTPFFLSGRQAPRPYLATSPSQKFFCKHSLVETHVDWILGTPDYIANEAFSVAVLFSLPTVLSKLYWANFLSCALNQRDSGDSIDFDCRNF